jgi:hypothetical protein
LHDIDPYDYLLDVLQRISEHPASKVEQLTPRLWKQYCAVNPLRSDLHRLTADLQRRSVTAYTGCDIKRIRDTATYSNRLQPQSIPACMH